MKATVIMSVGDFCRSVKTNRVFTALEQAFREATGRSVGAAERASWLGSLPRLSGAIELAELPDSTFIGLEVQIPYYSERIDAVLYGHDATRQPFVILVELKQWSNADLADSGSLAITMRSGVVEVPHPSFQVEGYRRHLTNFVRAFHSPPTIQVACCVYAHNYPGRDGSLFHPQYADVMIQAPVFCATDAEALADFIKERLGDDRGVEVVDRIRQGGFAPSKLLIDKASEMVRRQDVFTMLDEQIPAQQSIIHSINESIRSKSKTIVLVEGGPGTGKSVIALDALGHALRKKQGTYLVSGSAAFTHGMRRLLGPELASLVKFTDFFWEHEENSVDVLIVDEAHRIRTKSVPKVVAARRPKISQIEELVRAAKVTVLFMDVNQIIQPDESGDPEQVAALAKRLGIKLRQHRLRAQFRCDGSDEYLRWADALFELREAEERRHLRIPATFDFDVLDSPHEVLAWVQSKNAEDPNSARLTAGWCWRWSDPRPDRSLVHDIAIGDFTFPWELKNYKRGKPGIPQAKHWAVDPAGADQAGTVYSVQGYEFRHVGVLMGPDLVIRGGRWVANPRANFAPGLRAKPPEVASIYLRRIYRALFTRSLRSLRVFSVDPETREFLRSQLDRGLTFTKPTSSAEVLPFRRLDGARPAPGEVAVQLHVLKVAAGHADNLQYEQTPEWVVPLGVRKVVPGMIIAQIEGDSMTPVVMPGEYALFAPVPAGEDGMIVLAQLRSRRDSPDGGRFVLKKFTRLPDGQVVLESLNKTYAPILVKPDDELRVIARWVEVLRGDQGQA